MRSSNLVGFAAGIGKKHCRNLPTPTCSWQWHMSNWERLMLQGCLLMTWALPSILRQCHSMHVNIERRCMQNSAVFLPTLASQHLANAKQTELQTHDTRSRLSGLRKNFLNWFISSVLPGAASWICHANWQCSWVHESTLMQQSAIFYVVASVLPSDPTHINHWTIFMAMYPWLWCQQRILSQAQSSWCSIQQRCLCHFLQFFPVKPSSWSFQAVLSLLWGPMAWKQSHKYQVNPSNEFKLIKRCTRQDSPLPSTNANCKRHKHIIPLKSVKKFHQCETI